MKKLPEEFEGFTLFDLFKELTCLGKNTEQYITFSVPIEKDVRRIDKRGKGITKKISCRFHFVDSARFMAS